MQQDLRYKVGALMITVGTIQRPERTSGKRVKVAVKKYRRFTSLIEEADVYVKLLELRDETGKPKYSIRSLAMATGKDKSYIEDLLLYAHLTDDVRALIEQKPNIPPRIVRELQKLATPEERAPLIAAIHHGDLQVAAVRAIVKERTRGIPHTSFFPTG